MSTVVINKKDIKKWVAALRGGEYKQTRQRLQDDKGYCCLGVACELFIPPGKRWIERDTKFFLGDGPRDQEWAPDWLKEINGDFRRKTGASLIALNDDGAPTTLFKEDGSYYNIQRVLTKPFTFDEIADLLEAVYIYGVLK